MSRQRFACVPYGIRLAVHNTGSRRVCRCQRPLLGLFFAETSLAISIYKLLLLPRCLPKVFCSYDLFHCEWQIQLDNLQLIYNSCSSPSQPWRFLEATCVRMIRSGDSWAPRLPGQQNMIHFFGLQQFWAIPISGYVPGRVVSLRKTMGSIWVSNSTDHDAHKSCDY